MNEEVEGDLCNGLDEPPFLKSYFDIIDKFLRIILSHRMRILPLIFERSAITKIEIEMIQLFDIKLIELSLIGSKHYKYDLLEISDFDGLLDR